MCMDCRSSGDHYTLDGICCVASLFFCGVGFALAKLGIDAKATNAVLDSATPTECELVTFRYFECDTKSNHVSFEATAIVDLCAYEENATIPWSGEFGVFENCFGQSSEEWFREIPFMEENLSYGMKLDCTVNCEKGIWYTDEKITHREVWDMYWLGLILFFFPITYGMVSSFLHVYEDADDSLLSVVLCPGAFILFVLDVLILVVFCSIAVPLTLAWLFIRCCSLKDRSRPEIFGWELDWEEFLLSHIIYQYVRQICVTKSTNKESESSDEESYVYAYSHKSINNESQQLSNDHLGRIQAGWTVQNDKAESRRIWNFTHQRLLDAIQGQWGNSDGLLIEVRSKYVDFKYSRKSYRIEAYGGRYVKSSISMKIGNDEWVLKEPKDIRITTNSNNITWASDYTEIEWQRCKFEESEAWGAAHRKLRSTIQGDWRNDDDLLISISDSIITFLPSSNSYEMFPFLKEIPTLAVNIQNKLWILDADVEDSSEMVSWICNFEKIAWYRRQKIVEMTDLPPAYEDYYEMDGGASPNYSPNPSAPPKYDDNCSAPPLYEFSKKV